MSKIFVSYRRGDTAAHAGRLTDRLRQAFGANSVFMDVTTLEPGVDFVHAIEGAIGRCEILIVVIGKDWVTATGADGQRRLDDPDDFVRLETASALARSIPVIPVLVERAEMPRAQDLPDVLKPLVRRNAIELRDTRWDADVEALLQALAPRSQSFFTKRSRQVWVFGVLGAVGALAAAIWGAQKSSTPVTHEPAPATASPQQPAQVNEPATTVGEHDPSTSEPAAQAKAGEGDAAKKSVREAPPKNLQPADELGKPGATAAPSLVTQPSAGVNDGVLARKLRPNPSNVLLPSFCPPKTAEMLYDFALPASQQRGVWTSEKSSLALQTDAAQRNPCGGSSVGRLSSVDTNGGGAWLDLMKMPDRDWRGRNSMHLALRLEPPSPSDRIQILIFTSNFECVAEWTQAAPQTKDGAWFGLTFGLSKFDSSSPHPNDNSNARCELKLADVNQLGVKLFGATKTTLLSLGQLWLE